jgi:hypothetical protein
MAAGQRRCLLAGQRLSSTRSRPSTPDNRPRSLGRQRDARAWQLGGGGDAVCLSDHLSGLRQSGSSFEGHRGHPSHQ